MYYLLPLLTVLIWSGNAIVNKMAATSIDPAAIAFYRWALAFIVLTPFMLLPVWHNRRKFIPYLAKVIVLALLGMAINQTFGYYAGLTVSAMNIGIITSLIPLMTVLISLFVLSETPTVGIVSGTLLSLFGILYLVSCGDIASLLHQGVGSGELLLLTGSFAYALYGVLLKKWQLPFSTWQSVYIQIFFGMLLLLPNFLFAQNAAINAQTLPLIIYAGIPASVIAPFLWLQAVKLLGASKTAIFMNLMPVFTAMIAMTLLKEKVEHYHIVGGIITLSGVILSQTLRKPISRSLLKVSSLREPQ
ncbi:DMT family transporter [Plesiomonas sp.]|uniref:DMT family transporter n=1 Tax=Plesiomonas sp. TaxID=2486279 RepID=UPI003F3B42EE